MKKIGKFLLFLFLGPLIFGSINVITFFTSSIFYPFLFIYTLLLISITIEYSDKKKKLIYLTIVIYLIVMSTPYPVCDSNGGMVISSSVQRSCKCFGIIKKMNSFEYNYSVCLGVRTEKSSWVVGRPIPFP